MTTEEMVVEWVKNNTDESINSFDGERLRRAYVAGYGKGLSESKEIVQSLLKLAKGLPSFSMDDCAIIHKAEKYMEVK